MTNPTTIARSLSDALPPRQGGRCPQCDFHQPWPPYCFYCDENTTSDSHPLYRAAILAEQEGGA